MLENRVKSNEISFVSLADVPVADYFGKELGQLISTTGLLVDFMIT